MAWVSVQPTAPVEGLGTLRTIAEAVVIWEHVQLRIR